MVEAARALGRRAIVSTGWVELSLADDLPDCIQVAETNHSRRFFRTSRVSCTTAAPAPPPSPAAPELPRSRSRSSTTSTTGLSESSYLGSERTSTRAADQVSGPQQPRDIATHTRH